MTEHSLPLIDEFHTSHLTKACPKSVELKMKGMAKHEATQALFRGLWAHEAIQLLFKKNLLHPWDDECIPDVIHNSYHTVVQQLADEERPITEGCMNAMAKLRADVTEVTMEFGNRFGEKMSHMELIGVECPIRWTMPAYGRMTERAELASHVDIILRDTDNVMDRGDDALILLELKYKDRESLTAAWMHRSMQIIMYHLMLRYGSVQLPAVGGWLPEQWIEFGEWPKVYVVDLPMLKAYKRAGEFKTPGTGEPVKYKAGDQRPDHMVFRRVFRNADQIDQMKTQLSDHIQMLREGFFPMIPSETGCLVCECENWCPRIDM